MPSMAAIGLRTSAESMAIMELLEGVCIGHIRAGDRPGVSWIFHPAAFFVSNRLYCE
jgi:hypothetical protein